MGLFDRYVDTEKVKEVRLVQPSKIFEDVLRQASGSAYTRSLKYNIYYTVFAFYGVVDGVGTSTLVANTALALAEAGLTVCVIDTSMLAPTQDILLKTDEATYSEDKSLKHYDWFNMPFIRESPLHVSKLAHNVSVLSFRGGRRSVVDYLSPNDSESLVTLALSSLHSKFDIILIDCCHEMTSVNTACLQQAQQVIQVWNDSPVVMGNLEGFITNAITLSCPLDKMRYVIYNKLSREVMGSLDGVLDQYRLRKIGESFFSEELYLKLVTGKTLFRCESSDKNVIDYTELIIRIACHILNIDLTGEEKGKDKGKITANDVAEGKVDGTVTKKLKQQEQEIAVEVDKNPMHNPDFEETSGVEVENDSSTEPEKTAEELAEEKEIADAKAYAEDAMQYGGVMHEDDVKEADLADIDANGVPDIFEKPDDKKDKKKKKRGFFGFGG